MCRRIVGLALLSAINYVAFAQGANYVVVESKTVVTGARDVELGVYLSNTPPVSLLHLPLEIREVTPGSFIADTISLIPQNRLIGNLAYPLASQFRPFPDDTLGCWFHGGSYVDFVSPDLAFYVAFGGIPGRPCLPQGSDGLPPTGTPSLVLRFNVTDVPGRFEIIETCYARDSLLFSECDGPVIFAPPVTSGVVTIVPCACVCHGDPACDGRRDVQDVSMVVAEVFDARPAMNDSDCGRRTRCDLNCDCRVDVTDLVRMIAVVFRQSPSDLMICDGCDGSCGAR